MRVAALVGGALVLGVAAGVAVVFAYLAYGMRPAA